MPEGSHSGQEHVRIVLRPLGSGLPIGFFAYGVGSLLSAALQLHWIPSDQRAILCMMTLAFVAPMEWFAGVLGFLARDSAGGTTMTVYGSMWIALALFLLNNPAGEKGAVLGFFLLAIAIISWLLALVAWQGKPLLGVLLWTSCARFLLFSLVAFGLHALTLASGVVGVILTVFALYGAMALLMEDVQRRTVLPLFRRGAARVSMEGSLSDQIDRIAQEAGVRKQL